MARLKGGGLNVRVWTSSFVQEQRQEPGEKQRGPGRRVNEKCGGEFESTQQRLVTNLHSLLYGVIKVDAW
jgi:hypothetical protein